ncbi:MAG: peptidase S41 [Bacteroidia bacterium]|nr:MAG: peptidase S41 [Bacteroidia bacterium]
MVKSLICIFFACFFYINFLFTQNTNTIISHRTYSPEALSEDVKILEDVLLNVHPSIDYYHSLEWYKNYFDTSLVIHQSMTEKEFRVFLKKKLKVLQCGHTSILPSRQYQRYLSKKTFRSIPYYLAYFEPYLINIRGFKKEDTLLKSLDTILSLNNLSINEIADEFEDLLYVDAKSFEARNELLQKNLMFYYFGLYEQDSVLISFKNLSKSNIYIREKEYKYLSNDLWKLKSDTLMQKYGGKYHCGVYLDKNKKIYYMKIKAFSGISMKAFFRKTFRKLQKNNTEVLILDLRNNPGGKISQCLNLLSYLLPAKDTLFYETRIQRMKHKKYLGKKLEFRIIHLFMKLKKKKNNEYYIEQIHVNKKYPFTKKLYIITNCNTFSAANLVAVYLSQKRPNTKIVGTPTSGALWGSNAVSFLKLTLPNTKIRIFIPTFRIYHNLDHLSKEQKLNPVLPDIPNNYSPFDYLYKKDKALESIYQDLMKQ